CASIEVKLQPLTVFPPFEMILPLEETAGPTLLPVTVELPSLTSAPYFCGTVELKAPSVVFPETTLPPCDMIFPLALTASPTLLRVTVELPTRIVAFAPTATTPLPALPKTVARSRLMFVEPLPLSLAFTPKP